MKNKLYYIQIINNLIFIILITFFFNNFIVKITYILISIICSILINDCKLSKKSIICFALVCFFLLLSYIFGKNGISDAIINFIFLFTIYLQYINNEKNDIYQPAKIMKYINYIFCIIFIIAMIREWILYKDNYIFYFENIGDKNYSNIIVLLFFYYCYKNKLFIGKIASFIFSFLLNSRLVLLAIVIFYVMEMIRKYSDSKKKKSEHKVNSNKIKNNTIKIFNIILITTIGISILSYLWVEYIPVNTIQAYKSSLNDDSNAIRTRSNIYAIKTIISDKLFIYSGYDDSILKALGIEDISNPKYFLGYRIVQPHNLVLNLIMRYGIILTILYLIVLSKIISELYNDENKSFIMIYLFMNIFMHSLMSGIYLVFFIYLLTLKNEKIIKLKKVKNEKNIYM